ncbi:MAG: DUF2975 domain-containing protein [Candidatus Krumholzibacteria bacterium]|nr:DUF2975 domain-containing protein [Candidatus Krumholzibacteria bacterium]
MKISGLRSLTGFVKVVIHLAFGIALLAIVYSVGCFIYTMANADDLSRVATTELYEMPALAREQAANVWESENGDIRFSLHKLYGEFSYLNMPRGLVLAAYFRILVLCGLFFIGVVQMINVFDDVSAGKPFAAENARRLRIVGYAMTFGGMFKFIVQTGTFLLFRDEIAMKGASVPWLMILKETLNPGLILGGLIVIVISEVFRLGNQLHEEHELTV